MTQVERERLATLCPAMRDKFAKFRELALVKDVLIYLACGTRTFDEQDKLFAQGRTMPGKVVTYAQGGYSMHNFGVAFDIAIMRAEGLDWEIPESVAQIGESVGLDWGGRWTSRRRDNNHFQQRRVTLIELRQLYPHGYNQAGSAS
jgi:peptidoglycan L-alanyl-D-glutamate endopeptidase CwlK